VAAESESNDDLSLQKKNNFLLMVAQAIQLS